MGASGAGTNETPSARCDLTEYAKDWRTGDESNAITHGTEKAHAIDVGWEDSFYKGLFGKMNVSMLVFDTADQP